jgi:oxygen-independent coproporphyrinogen-3 oxidase
MAGLYFHIPFCRRKCSYCDFFSVPATAAALADYPQRLHEELRLHHASGRWRDPFATVFFGGGTPSLLPPGAISSLLAEVAELCGLAPGVEVSLEANPGTVTSESLADYRAAGVTRLSLGIQSLDAGQLEGLGRLHGPAEARRAIAESREAGFDSVGVDLMFALPGQTPSALEEELARVAELAPDHISLYGLTIEEGTPFARRRRDGTLELPGEDDYAAMFLGAHALLERLGYRHYEISNYARPGYECRHNEGYWRRAPYLGVGAGAHSLLGRGWGERRAVPADLSRYAERLAAGEDPSESLESFDRRGAMSEALYLGLRTASGVAEAGFRRSFGVGVAEAFPAAVERCGKELQCVDGAWRFTPEGWLLYDHLIQHFL